MKNFRQKLMSFMYGRYGVDELYYGLFGLWLALIKRKEDIGKGCPPKKDAEYFINGKNLFSILSAKYESYGHSRKEFREKICNIVIEYLDASAFEEKLDTSLEKIFNH